MNENRRFLYLIPLAGVLAIPQILFFWLAPPADCRYVVYAFCTVLTIAHAVMTFYSVNAFGIRRSAATVTVGAVEVLGALIAGAILLASLSSVRTAAFCLSIFSVIYIASEVLLLLPAMNEPAPEQRNPHRQARPNDPARPVPPAQTGELDYQRPMALQHEAIYRPARPAPARTAECQPTPPPLP